MKKYSLSDLYVLEVKRGKDVYYLICQYNLVSGNFVEIFTNEKIKTGSDIIFKPLSCYYSSFSKCDYEFLRFVKLDKRELLKKYIVINDDAVYESENSSIEYLLEKATLKFFPRTGIWYSSCFSRPEELSMENLPCHLRDDLWLAKMLRQNQKLFNISIDRILEFVKTSSVFQVKRHEYEQEIVKFQIKWMAKGGDNWISDKDYGGDIVFLTSVCDLGFRKGVEDTLLKIGIDREAIEEGIEKNAYMWRDSFMNLAFSNLYEPVFPSVDFRKVFGISDEKVESKVLEAVSPEFREKWIRMRKYEYYMAHKGSVDRYGVIEPDMMLTDEEVIELREYLKAMDEKRRTQIEQFRQGGNQKRVMKKKEVN